MYVRTDVPAGLLVDCPGYQGQPSTNGELAQAYLAERAGRVACNEDKAALREWNKESP